MLILPDASERSKQLLRRAIEDRFRITLLVFGDNNGEDVIASKADVRAQAMPSTRQVVWVRDPAVLDAAQRRVLTNDESAVVCALDLEDRPAAFLTRAEASSFIQLERAFLRAQQA